MDKRHNLSSYDIEMIAMNEIRYRGVFHSREDIEDRYERLYKPTVADVDMILSLIRNAEIVLHVATLDD